jgi:hypothetical protein
MGLKNRMGLKSIENIGMISLINYLSFTLIFFIFKSQWFPTGTSWVWIFLILTGIIQFINNGFITINPEICNEFNVTHAFTAMIVPWIFIFGLSCICLVFIPGWLRVFSNTFGVCIANWGGLKERVNKVFINETTADTSTSGTTTHDNARIMETIHLMYANSSKFINEVDISDYNDENGNITWNSLDKILTFMKIEHKSKHTEKKQLYEALVLKENAGYFAWFILIGSISVLVSINSVLLTSCNSIEFNL